MPRVHKKGEENMRKEIPITILLALSLASCSNSKAPAEPTPAAEKEETDVVGPEIGEATVQGYAGEIKVKVHFDNEGMITAIDTEHIESPGIGEDAIPVLTDAIIRNNGTEGVDDISGATITSQKFKQAVDEAIANAR